MWTIYRTSPMREIIPKGTYKMLSDMCDSVEKHIASQGTVTYRGRILK